LNKKDPELIDRAMKAVKTLEMIEAAIKNM
jgi:hypothetical protein